MHARSRLALVATLFAILSIVAMSVVAFADPTTPASIRALEMAKDANQDRDEIGRAILEYATARVAPGTTVSAGAFTAAYQQKAALSTVGGSWSEVTNKPYDSDAAGFRDPFISNSGGGSGLVSGRMSALAVAGSTIYAGGADGGVWRSTNGGASWTPVFDDQGSLSIGSIAVAPDGAIWVGTGEANTAFENYAGIGVLRSTSGSAGSWSLVGGDALNSTNIGKLAFDGNGHVYAATSKGLFRANANGSGSWAKMFDAATFGFTPIPYGMSIVNDVAVKPGTSGQVIVANMAWRNGAPYNNLYVSRDGGTTWSPAKTGGSINDKDIGRMSLAYAADGSKLYAMNESIFLFNRPSIQNGNTVLDGVFVSANGDPEGPYDRIANYRNLETSGSALNHSKGYSPGIQAWYNQVLGVDPSDSQHLYVGLEEVFETTDGGATWKTIGPYWNFPFSCWNVNPALDTCPRTTHPDQHAIAFTGTRVYVGNDGGIWSRLLRSAPAWEDRNATLRTLQYYYAGAGRVTGGDAVWGGLQDNGESLISPATGATMVSPFGGDGGDTIVDPNNGDRAVNEYVDLDMWLTTNGGRSDGSTHAWIEMTPSCFAFTYTPSPCDSLARFIAPFRADVKDINHWVAGGEFVWDNGGAGWDTRCSSTDCSWTIVYDTGAGHSTTAISVSGDTTYVGWCGGPGCNPSQGAAPNGSTGFTRGLATNYGGSWHAIDASGLPNRYVYSVTVDPNDSAHVYAVFGGFSRRWIPSAGVGHVFESKNGGGTWTDISGNLPDAPADDLLIVGSGSTAKLVLATDIGVFVANVNGGATTTWSIYGTGLPNASVNDLTLGFSPTGYLIAATHGRGIWKNALP